MFNYRIRVKPQIRDSFSHFHISTFIYHIYTFLTFPHLLVTSKQFTKLRVQLGTTKITPDDFAGWIY